LFTPLRRQLHPGNLILISFFLLLKLFYPGQAKAEPPAINIWYGPHQVFGRLGLPQTWINILGNVSDPDSIMLLTYSLNGGPHHSLSIGPDIRRLAAPGDFNIDIYYTELLAGLNVVIITATNDLNQQTVATVTVEYITGNRWPQPYNIDWRRVDNVQDVAQVVDGLWTIEADGLRPVRLGYDRLVAVGDISWNDYEVTVPITIHKAEPLYDSVSNGASVFVVTRWQGHRVWDDSQPAYGWWPLGAAGTVSWLTESETKLQLAGNKVFILDEDTSGRQLQFEVPYNFKIRAETIPGYASLYSFKVWEANQPEPVEWNLKGQQRLWDPMYGSVLLVAHHVDATFGNITVMPLNKSPWEWFILLGNYAAQTPLLLVCLVGIILFFIYRRRYPKVTSLILIAFILLMIEAIGGTYLNIQLPILLHRQGWSTHEIGLALVMSETLQSLLVAISLGLFLRAILPWRNQENL
jgi:hypothetical protein